MRMISWLISVLLMAVAVAFAHANRTVVVVSFWPSDLAFSLPVYAVGLGALGLGLLLGGLITGCGMMGNLLTVHRLRKELFIERSRASRVALTLDKK